MTQEQHHNLWNEHHQKAMEHLAAFRRNVTDLSEWEAYKAESKLANKHWGIEQAMYTKELKKHGFFQ